MMNFRLNNDGGISIPEFEQGSVGKVLPRGRELYSIKFYIKIQMLDRY